MTIVGKRRSKDAVAAVEKVAAKAASKNPTVVAVKTADSLIPRIVGLGIAGTGVAHFIAPAIFEPITKPAFPENTREWTYANGATETVIGLAIANRPTRLLGIAGLVGYVGFLGSRIASV